MHESGLQNEAPKRRCTDRSSVEPQENAQMSKVDAEPKDNEDRIEVPKGFGQTSLEGYQLARDRTMREIHPQARILKVKERINENESVRFKASHVLIDLCVDDTCIMSKDKFVIKSINAKLKRQFEMKELGLVQKILGGQFVLSKEQCPNSSKEKEETKDVRPYVMVLGCLVYVMRAQTSNRSASKLPPGPWRLPFLGNLHQLLGPLPHHTFRDLAKKHGPFMYLKIGQVPTIVVSSPEYAKEVMKVHDNALASRPNNLVTQILAYNGTDIIFAPYGQYWKESIFGAGSDTSSVTMELAMAEMMRNPRVMKKAQDEVREVFGKKGFLDESSINEMTYLKSVVKETLRLHPPAAMLFPRESREKCDINGYEIPMKTKILVNAWAIGRDPKYWIEPESFMPERFLESSIDFKGNNFEFIPFGAGRRICPGISFALTSIELPLAFLLYHFDWKLPNGMKPEELDMTERFGITVCRKKDLYLIPSKYEPPSMAKAMNIK
uniref:Cytochrome P450 n=1 Tax=Cannabis sativa TaxID=3483 RepID=A0A803Q844_CANSA